MDLSEFNYQKFLVVLTDEVMKKNIKDHFSRQEVEVAFKFVTSYKEAATLFKVGGTKIYNGVILNLSFSNQKIFDFVEYIKPDIQKNELSLLEYLKDGNIVKVVLTN